MVDIADLNPFQFGGGGMFGGSFAKILLVFFIAVVILALIGFLIWWGYVKKKYWIKLHVFRLIGNVPTRIAIYDACEVPFGRAGDKLWKVAGSGLLGKIKAVKWLPVGKIQSAPKEFWYYIREDQEWINFMMDDLNEISKKAKVKFTNEDMRLQRLATERLLEQRLMEKTFWEKWGTMVMTLIFFLVIAVCMVLIFYQFSKLVDEIARVTSTQDKTAQILLRVFGENFVEGGIAPIGDPIGLIPID